MVEKNAAAHAKLELLSNTAMLKKVLDRGIETKGKADDKAPQTNGGRDVSCIVSVPSPTPSDLRNQRGERTPSPQGVADTREAPPVPANRPVYIPAPVPAPAPAHAHYTYINEIEQHRTLSNRSAFVDARPRYAVPPTMIVTGHGDAYYYDHHRNASSMAGSSSHRHHPHQVSHIHGGASGNGTTTTMGPYHVQENVPPPPPPPQPPCAYMNPTTYSEHHTIDTHRQGSAPETIYFHHHHHIRSTPSDDHDDPRKSSYETLARENFQMREQLREKDMVVSSLQQRVNHLEKQISELRQLPTGKISHIPIE